MTEDKIAIDDLSNLVAQKVLSNLSASFYKDHLLPVNEYIMGYLKARRANCISALYAHKINYEYLNCILIHQNLDPNSKPEFKDKLNKDMTQSKMQIMDQELLLRAINAIIDSYASINQKTA